MKRILVIDDDETIRILLSDFLQDEYEVCAFASTKEALKHHHKTAFHLVITDIVMPEVDGFETIEAFRNLDVFLPVIAISEQSIFNKDEYKNMAKKIGADAFLNKPIEYDDLMPIVSSLILKNN